MKIEVSKKEFVKALQLGGSFAGLSKVLPILECVKIKVATNGITIVSTDNNNAISKRLSGSFHEEEDAFCVNFKDLMSYVKLIPTDSFYIGKEGDVLTISHDKGNITLPCTSANDFPVIKTDTAPIEAEISSHLLGQWISTGKTFVACDEFRPIMNGLYVFCKEGEIGCCATDGHVLYTDKVESQASAEFDFMLNRAAFRPVLDILDGTETINVRVGAGNVMFVGKDVSVIARKIEGKFPNFMSVIPQNNDINVRLNRKELIDAISRSSVGVSKESMLARVNVTTSEVEISCEDIDFSKKTIERINADSNGNITIGFKLSNLTEILNSMPAEDVIISMKEPSTAALLVDRKESNNTIYLIMPMLLA